MIEGIRKIEQTKFIPVDEWIPQPEDLIIRQCKGFIIAPLSQVYGYSNDYFDRFDLSIKKRAYNNDEFRIHYELYANYFEKFYDPDKELIVIYANIKYMIDFVPAYSVSAFLYDLRKFILHNPSMLYKINRMNEDNYNLSLSFKNKKKPSLQYTDIHAKILMKMSIIYDLLVPLLTHFISRNKIQDSLNFLLSIWDEILELFDIDIYSKLYETSTTNVNRNKKLNPIWEKQDIRSISTVTHAVSSIHNILLNVIPKYVYSGNIICLNYRAVIENTKYQVTDIGYEYDFIPLSSSKRDEDNNSEFDKFESSLTKQDEALYLQNKVNCEQTMKQLERIYNIDPEEVKFYKNELSKNNNIINDFQKNLIFDLFYQYFGDTYSVKAINVDDYVKLMIILKNMLLANNRMIILPYIISGRVSKLITRKGLNKRELLKLQNSPSFAQVVEKYNNNQKIINYIYSLIGTMLSSEFIIIDYNDPEIHGKKININPEILCEEICTFINLI